MQRKDVFGFSYSTSFKQLWLYWTQVRLTAEGLRSHRGVAAFDVKEASTQADTETSIQKADLLLKDMPPAGGSVVTLKK